MRLALAVLCIASFVGSGARADARHEFDAGKKAYDTGDFKHAIEHWKAGYALKPDPVFLFNLGQAYRQAGDADDAIASYKKYLEDSANPSNKKEVEARITDLQATSAKDPTQKLEIIDDDAVQEPATGDDDGSASPSPSPSPEPPVKDKPVEPPPSEGSPGRTLKIAGYATAGAGVALVATGIVFALQASSIQSDLEATTKAGKPWTPALTQREASGRSAAAVADATLVIGGIAAVVGGVLVGIGMHQAHAAEVSAWATPTGGGLIVAGSF